MRPAAIGRGGRGEASRRCWALGKRPGRYSAVSEREIEMGRAKASHMQDEAAAKDGRSGQAARRADLICSGQVCDRKGEHGREQVSRARRASQAGASSARKRRSATDGSMEALSRRETMIINGQTYYSNL